MFQKVVNLPLKKILFLIVLFSLFSCNEKHKIEVYDLEVSKLKLSSISRDGSLIIYPFFDVNEAKIIKIDDDFSSKEMELKYFVSDGIQFMVINKINNYSINFYNTIIIDKIPYSPIIINDSKLTKSENYYLSHIIRNVLFEDLREITNHSKSIKYSNEDIDYRNNLSPLVVSLNDKKQFSLIHFSNSNYLIETRKDILVNIIVR